MLRKTSRRALSYVSTRGGVGIKASFEQAICAGYAPDGGLYVPEVLPVLEEEVMEKWSNLGYRELAVEVMKLWVGGEVEEGVLEGIVRESLKEFPEEVVNIKNYSGGEVEIAELWHGPTHCFKDLSMSFMIRLLDYFNKKNGRKTLILAATTGDTGPAAVHSVGCLHSTDMKCYVFYPQGQISKTQELQMTTKQSDFVKISPFTGGGDDMDLPIKKILADKGFSAQHGIMGCNSYNVCRPLAQTIHFFWVYFRHCNGVVPSKKLDITIPVGAMGNIAAGLLAKMMGLPIGRLTAAVNSNDITCRAISKGDYSKSTEMERTVSEAINIQNPYNFERLMWYCFGGDSEAVKRIMDKMERDGKSPLSPEEVEKLQRHFSSSSVSNTQTLSAIKEFHETHGGIICPHTAVAYHTLPTPPPPHHVIFSTASPCKFSEAVQSAIGVENWKVYREGPDFPLAARFEGVEGSEMAVEFTRGEGEKLSEAQERWETMLRERIEGW